jgi:hypothetical protein
MSAVRTDLPLDPVPFAERVASPLWECLTPRPHIVRAVNRRFTDDQVLEIRRRVEAGERQTEIAALYNVRADTINHIVHFRRYAEVMEETA